MLAYSQMTVCGTKKVSKPGYAVLIRITISEEFLYNIIRNYSLINSCCIQMSLERAI